MAMLAPPVTDRVGNPSKLAPGLSRIAGIAVLALILFFLILPTLIVLPMSVGTAAYIQFPPKGLTLRWYLDYFRDPDWMAATWFSVKIALATTVAATAIGTLAAIAFVRGRLPGSELIQALSLSPLVIPHIVIAVGLYLVFAPVGLTGNFAGFLIAHTMLSVPYVVITVTAALRGFDPQLELAALNCGATRVRAFFTVVLPNILPGVAAGGVFAFLNSFDEATVAYFISGIDGKTIPRKLFEDIDFNLTPVIAAVSSVMVIVSLALMGGIEASRRHRSRTAD
jgi:mannopine transport system permease protein